MSRYSPADRERLLAWRRAMYGERAVVASREYLRWLFEDAPGEETSLWLYEHDGAIQRQEGAIRVDLKLALAELTTRAELVRSDLTGDWVDEIWARASREYPIISKRDRRFLEWRYARFPLPSRYATYRVQRGAKDLGWVVLRIGDHEGLRTGFIVDFLCAPRDARALLTVSLARLQGEGAERVHCLHTGVAGRLALASLGFVPRESGWPLMLRADLTDAERALASKLGAWFITAGDADVDRPREGTVFAH